MGAAIFILLSINSLVKLLKSNVMQTGSFKFKVLFTREKKFRWHQIFKLEVNNLKLGQSQYVIKIVYYRYVSVSHKYVAF